MSLFDWLLLGAYVAVGLRVAQKATLVSLDVMVIGQPETIDWALASVTGLFAGALWPLVLCVAAFYWWMIAPLRREREKRRAEQVRR